MQINEKTAEIQLVIQQIRSFNRYYTDVIGLIDKHLLNSEYSLAEARIIYEIFIAKNIQASQIMSAMHIDKSYLSRLLKKLEKDKIIIKTTSEQDARVALISLSEKGHQTFQKLNMASDLQIKNLVSPISQKKQKELIKHMRSIMQILDQQQ